MFISVEIDPEDAHSGGVNVLKKYKLDDDDETEVDIEDTIKGVRYGNQYYPWDDLNEEEFKVQSTKEMKVTRLLLLFFFFYLLLYFGTASHIICFMRWEQNTSRIQL